MDNVRIAAAYQADKDPQQDAVIQWFNSLPKDSRGGVKRSVLKYHITRALLMYIQSGFDSSASILGSSSLISVSNTGNSNVRVTDNSKISDSSNDIKNVDPINLSSPIIANKPDKVIPKLNDTIKTGNKLKAKIGASLKAD